MSEDNSYHDFDTLPLFNWLKANKGELQYLRICGGSEEDDLKAWELINQQHFVCFGMDKKHIQYLRLQKKIVLLKLDLIITGDKFIQNSIDIAQEQMDIFIKEMNIGSTGSLSDTLIKLSERAGYMITEMNITARRFFEMSKYYSKA